MSTEHERRLFARKVADELEEGFKAFYGDEPELMIAYREGIQDTLDLMMEHAETKEEYCELMGIRVAFID